MNNTSLTPEEGNLLALVDSDEVTDLLQKLIHARSDYPPGDCRKAIEVVIEKLNQVGIDHKIVSRYEHQPNLHTIYPEKSRWRQLMFLSHIDTVAAGEIENWHIDPYSGELIKGCIYGRGAGDDKSSVAAQIVALVTLVRARVALRGSLHVVIVSDKESGGLNGTEWLHQHGELETDALIVGEQTNNKIAVAERANCGIDLTIISKSASGTLSQPGENAVIKTVHALNWLQERLFPQLAVRKHPYLPPPILNVGMIQGGSRWSIVPERCKVEMDRLLLPGETREMAISEIRKLLDEFSTNVEPLEYELSLIGEVATSINTSPNDPFVEYTRQALMDVVESDRPLTGNMQTSDGRWFSRDRIPIIIFGPGDPALAHSLNEFVYVDQVVEATRFLALVALRWLQ